MHFMNVYLRVQCYFKSSRIRCNTVLPGLISTPLLAKVPKPITESSTSLVPLRRVGTVDGVASVFCFLASDESSYVTGAEMQVDGGIAM